MALPQSTFRASNIVAPDLSKSLSMIQQPGNLIRGYIDREDARERQAKQDERQRIADERAQTLFDQQQADRATLQAARVAEAQGPQTLAGVLTDTVQARPELLKGVELTPIEQENAEMFTLEEDGSTYDYQGLKEAGMANLADKLKKQESLSNAVFAPEAQESRVQQLEKIARQLANSGQAIIPNELVTSLNQARAAEIKVRADEKAQAAKASEGLREEANTLNLAIAKQKEKTGGYTVDADAFRENRNKLFAAVNKAASDAGVTNRVLKDNGIKKATSLYDRLVKDKVHPSTAMNIVSNAIFADTSSWNPWGDSLEVSDSFIQKLKSDALRADAQLGIGVFTDSASDPVMAALRDQAIDLNNRATKVNKTLARSLLTPEERQQASLAEVLGYKEPTKTPSYSSNGIKTPVKEVTFDREAALQKDNSDFADNPQDLGVGYTTKEEILNKLKEQKQERDDEYNKGPGGRTLAALGFDTIDEGKYVDTWNGEGIKFDTPSKKLARTADVLRKDGFKTPEDLLLLHSTMKSGSNRDAVFNVLDDKLMKSSPEWRGAKARQQYINAVLTAVTAIPGFNAGKVAGRPITQAMANKALKQAQEAFLKTSGGKGAAAAQKAFKDTLVNAGKAGKGTTPVTSFASTIPAKVGAGFSGAVLNQNPEDPGKILSDTLTPQSNTKNDKMSLTEALTRHSSGTNKSVLDNPLIAERIQQEQIGRDIVGRKTPDNDFLEPDEIVWYNNMMKTPQGRATLERYRKESSERSRPSFFEKQRQKYDKLKELGFTDAQIEEGLRNIRPRGYIRQN